MVTLRPARFLLALTACALVPDRARSAEPAMDLFKKEIQPVLDTYCYGCHGGGIAKGGVTLDEFANAKELKDHALWLRALRNVRSGIMPPADEPRLPPAAAAKLSQWIKRDVFELDPAVPDPGRVTVRRLNRVEYRNTVRDLTGVEVDTKLNFPVDDSGHGFDNIGDVLTVSPMLLEKYLDTAQTIIAAAVPAGPTVVAEEAVFGRQFRTVPAAPAGGAPDPAKPAPDPAKPAVERPAPIVAGTGLELSFYTPIVAAAAYRAPHAGEYQLVLELRGVERYVENQFDYNQCRLTFKVDGEPVFTREFAREGGKPLAFTVDRKLTAGDHELTVELQPVGEDRPQLRQLRLRLNAVTVRGPLAKEYWVTPKDYARFFPRAVPADLAGRRTYAGEILARFATRAFRRPVDAGTVTRLVALAERGFTEPGATFEAGVAQAMVAVLASPRFIFREEGVEPLQPGQVHPFVDDYALASRLSYFFWSTMPDEELFRLAREHRLRAELPAQVTRLLRDERANELVKNFTGQWLQARDIAGVAIDGEAVFLRDHPPTRELREAQATIRRIREIPDAHRTPADTAAMEKARRIRNEAQRVSNPPQLGGRLREAMQEETELHFAHILKEDRPLTELIDCNYTFLNEELAKHYGIPGVSGRHMRKVMLPPDSPRGGVLTQGTVLAVTSNPTRTSPVKRGVFILDAILGTPPAPPPPNIPSLEDAASPEKLRTMTIRENMALHATNPMCYSCHSRMDPLGLALENFNALGQWRTQEANQPIESAGQLITGEKFADIRELKRILATAHRDDFFHNVSEKLLTYALGRGVDYTDTDTLDGLVARLVAADGRPSALIRGIVESAPFQQRRRPPAPATTLSTVPSTAPSFPAAP
jgi:mono/diheme cytochrome c family protein